MTSRRHLAGAAALAVAAAIAGLSATAADRRVTGVAVVGSQFRVGLADGTVVPQRQLPGTVLTVAAPVQGNGTGLAERTIRIDAVEPDPRDPTGEVMLYTLSERSGEGAWRNICEPDPDGRSLAFPLEGSFTADMHYRPTPGALLITCTSGAEGKCVRFGYAPWRRAADGTPLLAYYQACVRLVRADYCGDGVGHTRNGTPIDLFDRLGIQADVSEPGLSFEAAFGPDGAVCVRRQRYVSLPAAGELLKECPRLAAHVGDNCSETTPALLYVRSFER